ncbi:hypothetical protein FCZ41_23770 [Escherichia coli]|nr:hypothetical protein [Escherichia coli]
MGSCAAPSAKGDDKFITTDYLQQCPGPRRILSAAVCNRRSARRLLVRVCARRVCNRREGIDPAIQPVDSPSITHRKPSITHRGVL